MWGKGLVENVIWREGIGRRRHNTVTWGLVENVIYGEGLVENVAWGRGLAEKPSYG